MEKAAFFVVLDRNQLISLSCESQLKQKFYITTFNEDRSYVAEGLAGNLWSKFFA